MTTSSGIIASASSSSIPPPPGVPSDAVSVNLEDVFLAIYDPLLTSPVAVSNYPVGAVFNLLNPKFSDGTARLRTKTISSLFDVLPVFPIDIWVYMTFIADGPFVSRVSVNGFNGTPLQTPTTDFATSLLLKINNGAAYGYDYSSIQGIFGRYSPVANWYSMTIAYIGWTQR